MKAKYHKGDDPWGRASYEIPENAIVGSSDTGMASDSPCPSDRVNQELTDFVAALMKGTGIQSYRADPTQSGNVFMIKQWVTVDKENFEKAAEFARGYLRQTRSSTRYIHDADLDDKNPQFIEEESQTLD